MVNNGVPSEELLERYGAEKSVPVVVDREGIEEAGIRVIEADLISREDLVRHDPVKLSKLIRRLVFNLKDRRRG